MSVSALLFDLDDTLWPCKPTIIAAEKAIFQWLLERFPLEFQQETLDSLRHKRIKLMQDNPGMVFDLTKVRQVSIAQLCRQYGVDESIADAGTAVFRFHRNKVKPYDDVVPVLSQLQSNYLLASVTNGNAEIEKTSLAAFFDYRVTAAEVGKSKPEPEIFLAACEAGGFQPEQCLMVGDDVERDMAPAKKLGMKTLLINRNNQIIVDQSAVDWVAIDLYGLQKIL